MAESMKDFEKELEESMKKIEEGDILTGTVISVDEKEVILDLKYYAEGVIPVEDYSREPGFNIKEEVHEGDEVSATVVRKDDGHGNILLSRVEASDILAWDKLEELKSALNSIGVEGMTVSQVYGCGLQKGHTEVYRGREYKMNLIPGIKIETVVCEVPVEKVIAAAQAVLKTGEVGDGKIFVFAVENAVRIRTGVEGAEAIMDEK